MPQVKRAGSTGSRKKNAYTPQFKFERAVDSIKGDNISEISRGLIAIADRGQGVLTTLKKVRPNLKSDQGALKTAFTEIISGRAPESRGNGLKFVRKIVAENNFNLAFQSGQAELKIKQNRGAMTIGPAKTKIQGCLALIKF